MSTNSVLEILYAKDGSTEVAVKVVRKDYFKQDPKVRENLEREIRILKLLRGCEYVVKILHVQVNTSFIPSSLFVFPTRVLHMRWNLTLIHTVILLHPC